ncbi:hypothetical protein WM40_00720 [Robbsia andropogonis]|uniref:Uncharacterized protein n=1 Tax=Robbsia andropogonis TaxID=28092 RepID=A0A0F5K530_9BURK|nr:hypothetical protein WM40_00720 [Robbsia andropogonis]
MQDDSIAALFAFRQWLVSESHGIWAAASFYNMQARRRPPFEEVSGPLARPDGRAFFSQP